MLTSVHRLGGGDGAEPDEWKEKKGEVKGGERVWALAGSLGSGPERGLAHSSATSPVSD